jgi:hypothetical protein
MRVILCALALLLSLPAFAEKWALLIGINDYEDRNYIASLGAADNDARKLKEVLKSKMGFPDANIELLVSDGDNKPTRSNIILALGKLAENAKAGDTVFVFYSGHGTEINGVTYLLPHDFKGRNKFTGTETALEIAKFKGLLGEVKARALIMAWDMCRNDPFAKGKSGDAARSKMGDTKAWTVASEKTARSTDPPVVVNLFACSPGESSFEWTDRNRGYFAWFLEEGMKGAAADANGNITLGNLAKYVREKVTAETKASEPAVQSPTSEMAGASPEEFVLLGTGKPGPTTTPIVKPVGGGIKTVSTRSTLTFTGAPRGAKIVVNKAVVKGTSWAVDLLEPSREFEVTITAPGYRPKQLSVPLEKGQTLAVDASLEKEEESAPDPGIDPGNNTKVPPPQTGTPGALDTILSQIRQTHRVDLIARLPRPLKFYGSGLTEALSHTSTQESYFGVLGAANDHYRVEYVDQGVKKKIIIGFGGGEPPWKLENTKEVKVEPDDRFFGNPVGPLFYVLMGKEITLSEKFSRPLVSQPYLSASDPYLGDFKILYDPKTFRIVEISLKRGGMRPVFKYQNWKSVEGIPMPHLFIEDVPIGNITWTYSRIEPNAPYGEAFFAKPR